LVKFFSHRGTGARRKPEPRAPVPPGVCNTLVFSVDENFLSLNVPFQFVSLAGYTNFQSNAIQCYKLLIFNSLQIGAKGLGKIDYFEDSVTAGTAASMIVKKNGTKTLKYDPATFGFGGAGGTIGHELTHAYQYDCKIVTYPHIGEEADERFAYIAEYLYKFSRISVGDWELSLFHGINLQGDPVDSSKLIKKWDIMWDSKNPASLPSSLLSQTIEWTAYTTWYGKKIAASRATNEIDYLVIKTAYNLGVSCEKVRAYSLTELLKHGISPSCIKCPSSLSYAFQ